MKLTTTILIASIFLIIFGCSQPDVPYYYNEVAARTNALVKFKSGDLDIYDHSLKATLETAIDVTNADTAYRVILAEVIYPEEEGRRQFFRTPVEMLDFQNFANALQNMLRMRAKTDVPLIFKNNLKMEVRYLHEKGYVLTDSAGIVFTVPAGACEDFVEFMMNIPAQASSGPADDLAGKQAFIDSVKTAQIKKLRQVYRYRELKLQNSRFKVAAKSAKADEWQIDCKFTVTNNNVFECKFDVSIDLLGDKRGSIYHFKSEDITIPANSVEIFTRSTVLQKFQAERVKNLNVQVFNVRTDDKMAEKYME